MPAATKSSAATFKQRPQCSDFDICCCFLLRWNAALVFWRESLNETDDRAPWDRYTTADWCHLCGPLSFRKLLVLVQDPVYSYSDCHIVRCKCHVMSYSVCKGPRLCWQRNLLSTYSRTASNRDHRPRHTHTAATPSEAGAWGCEAEKSRWTRWSTWQSSWYLHRPVSCSPDQECLIFQWHHPTLWEDLVAIAKSLK